jgi:hypothetical protein
MTAVGLAAMCITAPATSMADSMADSTASANPAVTPAQAPTPATARLELVGQQFATAPDGNIQLQYLLTGLDGDPLQLIPPAPPAPPPPAPPVEPGAEPAPDVPIVEAPAVELPAITVEITNYSLLDDPDDVAELVGSDVDPDAFSEVGDAIDGVLIDARPLMTRNDDGTVNLTLDIGTDVVDSVETRLKLDRPGVYPLRIRLLLGDPDTRQVIATAGTVIQRLAGATDIDVEVAPPIDLSVVSVATGPAPGADEQTLDLARARLDQVIELAATITAPITLQVAPTLIAEAAATPEGSDRLATALENDEMVALPTVPLDVSSAVAADRADTFTRLLTDGQDLLTDAVPSVPNRRDVWITADALSAPGAQHLRDLGVRFVVIPPALFEETIGDDLPPSDQFVEAELPDGGMLPLLVVDPLASQLTEEAADRILARATPTEWAVATLGDMLVAQAADDARASPNESGTVRPTSPARRSRILTTPDLASPDARLLQALVQLTSTTPAVRFTLASELTGFTDVLLDDGEPVTIQLPDEAGPSLTARVELIDDTASRLESVASMLPEGDERVAEWSSQLDVLISTGFTDTEAEAALASLLAEADTFAQAVVLPEPFEFTLTGRSGTIEVGIRNTLDEPLDVVVALDSAKVKFPDGDQLVTLLPLEETSVIVPVEAEANGTSEISLVVSTPAGEALGEPVTLKAQVTALTGLGQVLTGGLILVLLTWWFTNWRGRRRSLLDDGRGRHPSTSNVESKAL